MPAVTLSKKAIDSFVLRPEFPVPREIVDVVVEVTNHGPVDRILSLIVSYVDYKGDTQERTPVTRPGVVGHTTTFRGTLRAPRQEQPLISVKVVDALSGEELASDALVLDVIPWDFELSNVRFDPERGNITNAVPLTITVDITNHGIAGGLIRYVVQRFSNQGNPGPVVYETIVDLDPRQSQEVSYRFTPELEGGVSTSYFLEFRLETEFEGEPFNHMYDANPNNNKDF